MSVENPIIFSDPAQKSRFYKSKLFTSNLKEVHQDYHHELWEFGKDR